MFTGRGQRGVPLYGIALHTTGSGILSSPDPLARAVQLYTNSGGPHYVIGWDGTIVATVADENIRGAHAGMSNTRSDAVAAYNRRSGWESMVSPKGAELWHKRWPGKASPVDLIPGGNLNSINTLFLGIEMIPIAPGVAPAYPGSRFTAAQHDAARALAHDIARRHGFPSGWSSPSSTRLVGHSDLNPVERDSPALPLWDPGYHSGMFDMDRVRGGNLGWLVAGGVAVVAGVWFARYLR